MKYVIKFILIVCTLNVFFIDNSFAQSKVLLKDSFNVDKQGYVKVGKGDCYIRENKLINRDAYASFGGSEWINYRFSFEAKTPKTEEQVQIWASFREQGRNERYLVGLKGGYQNDIEIARMGLMGDDAFLGIRNLDFEPALGVWYKITIEICKNRIRIFLNNEEKPRIDVVDENAELLPSGKVALGGAWIKTEFRNLLVERLPDDYLDDVKAEEYSYYLTKEEKEVKRKDERKQYESINVASLNAARTEISLDGNWLFKPEHEFNDAAKPFDFSASDENWHILEIPNFWNPSRIWLHGETFMEQKFPKGASDTYYQKETDRCENYTFDYKKTKIGWYRQWVNLPEQIAGKHLELSFDAVSKVSEVYVNGEKAGANIGMFGAFTVDVSELVNPGKNLIAVKVLKDYVKDISDADEIATIAVTVEVTNQMLKDLPHGFFRDNPAGIWQPVKLIVTEPVKIEDVFIKPNLTGANFDVTLKNYGLKKSALNLNSSIIDKQTGNLLHEENSLEKIKLAPGEEQVFTFSVNNLTPKLWSPEDPNLYRFSFTLTDSKSQKVVDAQTIVSGFRTFETKGDYFYLNGKRYWLRAANHTPHALGINDAALAERTFELYHEGNIAVTRSHTIPYSEVWLKAADEEGVGLSFEGTWPWLMIGVGENSIPDENLLKIWREEWLGLMKKYRNHPSVLYWTINNEMNFTHNKDEVSRIEKKMGIVSDVVKQMRKVDPTRPLCFDSGYTRKQVKHKHDSTFFKRFDDGDIDDGHNYSGWYHSSIFNNFTDKPFMNRKTEGRPLITQEWSTGYPNTETGHHTRSYLWQHQNTQTHIGNQAYPFGNPKYSLENNAFLTSELVEAVRRTHEKMAGMHNFSSITWFQNVYDAQRVEPYPTYYRMKNSLNPVLVSAELWGRHFYPGEKLPTRFCVVNDKVDGKALEPTTLKWEITHEDNRVISSGSYEIPKVEHYGRYWMNPEIVIPGNFDQGRLDGKLRLFLIQNGEIKAQNEYDLMVAKPDWIKKDYDDAKDIVLVDYTGETNRLINRLNINVKEAGTLDEAFKQKADLYIISGISQNNLSTIEKELIRDKFEGGHNILLLNTGSQIVEIFPDYVSGYLDKTLETAHIDIPESEVFNGVEYMDLRYFNNNKLEKPLVYNGLMQVYKKSSVKSLVSGCEHRYARKADRRSEMLTMKGFPVISIENGGRVILSEMLTAKGIHDPVAGKLLMNMICELLN